MPVKSLFCSEYYCTYLFRIVYNTIFSVTFIMARTLQVRRQLQRSTQSQSSPAVTRLRRVIGHDDLCMTFKGEHLPLQQCSRSDSFAQLFEFEPTVKQGIYRIRYIDHDSQKLYYLFAHRHAEAVVYAARNPPKACITEFRIRSATSPRLVIEVDCLESTLQFSVNQQSMIVISGQSDEKKQGWSITPELLLPVTDVLSSTATNNIEQVPRVVENEAEDSESSEDSTDSDSDEQSSPSAKRSHAATQNTGILITARVIKRSRVNDQQTEL